MRNTAKNNASLFDSDPSVVIALYKIDLKDYGNYLFHAGENGYKNKIVFNSQNYDYYPIEVDGFEMHGDGRLPRPKLTFSNHKGNISMKLPHFNDFINYKVTRIKTFVKYLDAVNFPNNINPHADPDPDASFAEDVFYVNQKIKEDDNVVEFELVSLLELENANIPARTMYSNACPWAYRGNTGCGYRGKPISDGKNKKFTTKGYNGAMVGSETYFTEEESDSKFGSNVAGGVYPDWASNNTYQKGDIVRIVFFSNDEDLAPPAIYVCINDNVKSNPVLDRVNWVKDDCDKTLCGCRLRFSDDAVEAGGGVRLHENKEGSDNFWTESEEGLPFGGFPGIDPYDFK
jgi:lambda family phage minor tail protein L